MTKYIPDINSHRWVILAPGRFNKPSDNHKEFTISTQHGVKMAKECAFCRGNENTTPAEIERIERDEEWLVRVFSNKYPITDIHEVIVHHPDHFKEIEDFSPDELFAIMKMYQRRLKTLSKVGVPILFRNKGQSAGTSIPHPHSQIIVLPQQINLEALALEPVNNIVLDNDYFVLYCPDFSQYPFEIWITHKKSRAIEINSPEQAQIAFADFSETELQDLGILLQKAVRALSKSLGDFDYNYYFSPTAPFYLRLIPRLLVRGGFELGTGLSTNTLDPKEAAEKLRQFVK